MGVFQVFFQLCKWYHIPQIITYKYLAVSNEIGSNLHFSSAYFFGFNLNAWRPKMVRHTLKILQQMLQDFESVSDHFGSLCINRLTYNIICWMNNQGSHYFLTIISGTLGEFRRNSHFFGIFVSKKKEKNGKI